MYSIIVPVFNNAASLPELLEQIAWIGDQLDGPIEVVFVIDGSPDNSYVILRDALPKQPFHSRLICHSRNFGSFDATRTGLNGAAGPYFARISADLQEPPELMVDFFHALSREPIDVAIGTRTGRADPLMSRLFSAIYWSFYRRLIIPEIPPGGVDAFACNDKVRDVLCRLAERNTSLVGLLFWLGFRRKFISYKRKPRPYGKSAWGFRRKIRYMFDSVYAFTDLPITLLTVLGAVGVIGSLTFAIMVLIAWSIGWITVLGYTPTVLLVSFFGAMNMFSLGVIGAYVWRTFENTKGRPQAIVFSEEEFVALKSELERLP
jgi:glycosyltransferase involved in cell wall biosynthesis